MPLPRRARKSIYDRGGGRVWEAVSQYRATTHYVTAKPLKSQKKELDVSVNGAVPLSVSMSKLTAEPFVVREREHEYVYNRILSVKKKTPQS